MRELFFRLRGILWKRPVTIGKRISFSGNLRNLSNVYWEQGKIAKAVAAQQESLGLSRELNDKLHESVSLGNIAGLLQLQGKLGEARQDYEQSLRLDQEMGDKEGIGLVLGNMADLLARQGDLTAAKKCRRCTKGR